MLKFKSWKGRDKWLFFLTIGVILCILAFPVESLTQKTRAVSGSAGGIKTSAAQGGTGGNTNGDGIQGSGAKGTRWQESGNGGGTGPDGKEAEGSGVTDGASQDAAAGASGIQEAGAALEAAARVSNSYEAELEQRVREILKNVDGVGKVDVMIVLKSSAQKVVHTDSSSSRSLTDEKDSTGGTRKIENEESGDTTVFTTGDGQSTPIIEKELRPELSGIIISASGGGNPTVRAEISAAMEALFDLPAHKIKVLKRVE